MKPHMAPTYRAFCDESGQRDYGPGTDRYFVVAAVVVPLAEAEDLAVELAGLKRAYWGVTDVELKSNWIRQPGERQKHYLDPYGVSLADINSFVDGLYRWICNSPVKLLAGVVDKLLMQNRYISPHYPGGVAYDMFLQRFQKFLAKRHGTGDVHFDDPSGKSPGGSTWRTLLQKQHTRLKRFGCPYTQATFPNVEDLAFVDSAKQPFVQVADVVAYNTFRQFRDHGADWEKAGAKSLPLYSHFAEVVPAFDTGPGGEFSGFSVAKWPIETRVRWVFKG